MEVLQDTYKDTKIGRIPKEWGVHKMSEIGSFFKGKSIPSSRIKESGVPIIRYGDIYVQYKSSNKITHYAFFIDEEDIREDKLLKKGDIVLSGTGETQEEIGKAVAFLEEDRVFAGGDIIVFRPNEDYVNSEILSYILNTGEVLNLKCRLGQGLSIFHLYSSHLENLPIPLPPLPEQQKIAAILSTVDEQISTTDKIIEKSKELKKGLMQKLFSKGIGHTEFKDTKIGRIPKEWDLIKLSELGKFYRGHTYSAINVQSKGLLVLRSTNIQKRTLVLHKDLVFVDKDCKEDILLRNGDLVICMANGSKRLVGKSAKYFGEDRKDITIGAFCSIYRSKNVLVNYLFESYSYKKYLQITLAGSTINNLKNSELEKFTFPFPPLPEQQKIADILSEADAKIKKEQTQKVQLEQLKKGLMQQLLTGKKRVKV